MISDKLRNMGLNLMPLRPKFGSDGSPNPDSKRPLLPEWKHLQSRKYVEAIPDTHNFAVICGSISDNLLVLDLDDESLYNELSDYHNTTFTVKTGKRGYHIYFRYHDIVCKNKKLFDPKHREIDIKAEGGYVVGPTSIHPETGKEYEIVCDKPIADVDLEELQKKLQDMGFNPDKKSLREIEHGIKVGDRNDATFKYACFLIRKYQLHGEALWTEIEKLNSRHTPPLPRSELSVIVDSALKYEAHNIEQKGLNTFSNLKNEIRDYLEENPEVIDLSRFQRYTRLFKRKTIEDLFNEYAGRECEFTFGNTLLLQQVKPDMESVPIQFDAMIIAAGERQTYTQEADFDCPSCNEKYHKKCNQLYRLDVPKCPKCHISCDIDYNNRITKYIQQIRIQEFLDTARNNTPVEFDAEILDDDVGEAYIGDRKTFVGKFRSIPAKPYNTIVFEIIEMNDLDQKVGCQPTEEELAKWKSDPELYDKIVNSIAPELYLRPELKETCMLSMARGTAINGKRANIHSAFIGDAQLAKSELLTAVNEILVGSAYAMGRQASNAGLTIGMMKLYNGTMVPRAGLLPTHTGNLVCLDEVDKMRPEDREGALECMEQGHTTLNKVGHPNTRLPADTTIIAAGNPKNGKFNPDYPSIMQNFNLEFPFLTRFDILWLLTDTNTKEDDQRIRDHIRRFKKDDSYMTVKELQRYFSYVRTLEATIPEVLESDIDQIHTELREASDLNELEIGWRLYYGLYRMIGASAKLHLRTEANMDDVNVVKRIVFASIDSLRRDGHVKIKTGKQTKEDVFLTAWGRCCDADASVNRDEFLEDLAKCDPFNTLSADTEFEKYKNAGKIHLINSTGRYAF